MSRQLGISPYTRSGSCLKACYIPVYTNGKFAPADLLRYPRRDVTYSAFHSILMGKVYWGSLREPHTRVVYGNMSIDQLTDCVCPIHVILIHCTCTCPCCHTKLVLVSCPDPTLAWSRAQTPPSHEERGLVTIEQFLGCAKSAKFH